MYSSRVSKILSYSVRLYYEFLECTECGGRVFFYTLTYNDLSIPTLYGCPCFDYNDIRDFVHGAFQKKLCRDFGCTMKYAVFCERGEGKGKRGFGNNPHYHVIFYLYPKEGKRFDFVADEVTLLVRKYWQGDCRPFDVDGVNPQSFKYGIVQVGKYGAEALDYRAFRYCAKYCVKDAADLSVNRQIWSSFLKDFEESVKNDQVLIDKYMYAHNQYSCSIRDAELSRGLPKREFTFFDCATNYHRFFEFHKDTLQPILDKERSLFLNRFCARVRISQGVGISALKKVIEHDDGSLSVPLPSKNSFEDIRISDYLLRKLLYDVKKDPITGNNYYTLNEYGQSIKMKQLQPSIARLADKAFSLVSSNPDYNSIYESYSSADHDFRWSSGAMLRSALSSCTLELCSLYALYKKVYEFRSFAIRDFQFDGVPSLDPLADYYSTLFDFHQPILFGQFYSHDGSECFDPYFIPYSAHPIFAPHFDSFCALDILLDYATFQDQEVKSRRDAENRRIKNFHNNKKFKHYSLCPF